jgi:hypothetical protein
LTEGGNCRRRLRGAGPCGKQQPQRPPTRSLLLHSCKVHDHYNLRQDNVDAPKIAL